MPVVPITKGVQPTLQGGNPSPSETSMLMALAEMHKQGRFEPPSPSFADRAAPITRDIKSGIADAAGKNFTTFEKSP